MTVVLVWLVSSRAKGKRVMSLILAGILAKEYDGVKATFESTGRCTELFSIQEKEWRGGTYLVK